MERNLFLEQLVEVTDQGVWLIDFDGKSLDVNPAMCRLLGRTREEALQGTVYDFVDDANRAIFEQELSQRKAGKNSSRYKISLQHPDGRQVPCINNANSVWDENGERVGAVGIWTDITDIEESKRELNALKDQLEARVLKQTEALQRNQELLRQAHRVAQIGSWEETEENMLLWSSETRALFGCANVEEQVTLEQFYSLVHPQDREQVIATAEEAWEHNNHYTAEYRILRPDGTVRHMREAAAVLSNDEGQTVGLSGVVQDVTDQVTVETQLRQAQKMEAIGQLTGGVAHDFNNLLAVVIGNLELIRDLNDPERSPGYLDAAITAAQHGADLTRKMLSFSGQSRLEPKVLNLNDVVVEIDSWSGRALPANVEVQITQTPDLWAVRADPSGTQSAVLNLIVNARDAMPDGGALAVTLSNVDLRDDHPLVMKQELVPGRYVALTVRDTGVGIDDKQLDQVFEPFFTTKPPGSGSGLGLSMTQGFMKQSGGTVHVSSDLGLGTEVALYFPVVGAGPGKGKTETILEAAEPLSAARILLVEDEPQVRHVLTEQLTREGYSVHPEHSGDAALAHWQTDDAFDLVISDFVMPGRVQGDGLLAALRQTSPDLPAIVLTGYAKETLRMQQTPGVQTVWLNKPIARLDLLDAVGRVLASA